MFGAKIKARREADGIIGNISVPSRRPQFPA